MRNKGKETIRSEISNEYGKKKFMIISKSVLRLNTVVVLDISKTSELRAWRYVTHGLDE